MPIFDESTRCHADPNLVNYFGANNFIGDFGQSDGAQIFLSTNSIKEGDIFLFFGWFKEGAPNERRTGTDKNIIFGYLEIERIVDLGGNLSDEERFKKAKINGLDGYPHLAYKNMKHDCIYIATEKLSFDKTKRCWGTFDFHEDLVMTSGQKTRMHCLIEGLAGLNLTNETSWEQRIDSDGSFQLPKSFGQEFIIEDDKDSKAVIWVKELLRKYAKNYSDE